MEGVVVDGVGRRVVVDWDGVLFGFVLVKVERRFCRSCSRFAFAENGFLGIVHVSNGDRGG